jgi:hypothetical protein
MQLEEDAYIPHQRVERWLLGVNHRENNWSGGAQLAIATPARLADVACAEAEFMKLW